MTEIITTHEMQNIAFTNTKATMHNDRLHCGAYQYEMSPIYDFVNIIGSDPNWQLDVFTDDILKAGTYPLSLKVWLPEFPMISEVTKNFLINVYCDVTSIAEIIKPVAYSEFLIGV